MSDNIFLYSLSRMVSYRFVAVGSPYDITSQYLSVREIKSAIWNTFDLDSRMLNLSMV